MDKKTVSIERLTSWRIDEALDLLRKHARTQLSFAQLLRYCIERNSDAFLAMESNEVVGIIAGHVFDDEKQASIDLLCVHENHRNRGIANKLADRLMQACGEDKSYALEVRVSNLLAQSLYKSWGFSLSSIRPMYYRNEDAVTMIRSVQAPEDKQTMSVRT